MADTAMFFNLLKVSCSVVVVGAGVLRMVRVSAAHTLDIFFFFLHCGAILWHLWLRFCDL